MLIDAVTVLTEECFPCPAGIDAPALSSTTISNVCPVHTYDLTSITASNGPVNTSLTWHTGTPATTANKVGTPAAVTAGIYYAAFYSASDDCYSGINGEGTTMVETSGDSDCDGVLDITDIDDDNDGVLDIDEVLCPLNLYNGNEVALSGSGGTLNFSTVEGLAGTVTHSLSLIHI